MPHQTITSPQLRCIIGENTVHSSKTMTHKRLMHLALMQVHGDVLDYIWSCDVQKAFP